MKLHAHSVFLVNNTMFGIGQAPAIFQLKALVSNRLVKSGISVSLILHLVFNKNADLHI